MVSEQITLQEENTSLYFAGEKEFAVSYFKANRMSFYGLRLEYSLQRSLNYIDWKDKMEALLEDNGLKDFIEKYIPNPPVVDAQDLAKWRKCVAKARRIILE